MKKILPLVLATMFATFLISQNNNIWQDVAEVSLADQAADRLVIPDEYRTLSLDLKAVREILDQAPMRFSLEAQDVEVNLPIPMPGGGFQNFRIVEAPIMHPDLAARYPDIQSFAGWSEDDPTAYLRFGVTQKGFHAILLSSQHSSVYIDAYATGDDEHYISYFKKDYLASQDFECHVEAEAKPKAGDPDPATRMAGDCQFRQYRLALACTGEYAQFHGGTVALVMAEYNVAMTRVNGIYELDAGVTMELVPDTDELIFLNANTDPYTNNSGGTMLGQNQTTVTNVIGSANYDIGHVFSTGGGGIAGLGVICSNNNKARGVTGLPNPINDPFYVDYVAHEMGHQFGANHTQNNPCNRNGATAMEPGSASTIMGYAGICSPNVQNNSDDYFHAISLSEIANRVTGTSCATILASTNNAPSVTEANGTYNVPVSTPFALTADGTDPDGDALTYCWEQMDNQVADMPPEPTNTGGPAFRTLDPDVSPTRYFPNLNAVIVGNTPTWEVLPSVNREMNFRCTVRDGLCTDETDVELNFSANAGPFLVESPNTSAVTWTALGTEEVTWDVANTDNAPVNASTVDIFLSEDGGQTYPYTLAEDVPNNGSFMMLVPNVVTTDARVMVKGHGNIFFDISDEDFTIQMPAVPTFGMSIDNPMVTACQNGEAEWAIDFLSILGFNEGVNLTLDGLPAGATSNFSPNPIMPAGQAVLTIDDLENVMEGSYDMTVTANHPVNTISIPINLTVIDSVTTMVAVTTPADGATGLPPMLVSLLWETISGANAYLVEVSDNPSFNTILASTTVSSEMYDFTGGSPETVYYWRVRPFGICNDGEMSNTFAFQTSSSACDQFNSQDTPIAISPTQGGIITSEIDVTLGNPVTSITAYLDVSHTYVGDLTGMLTAPGATEVMLFDQPGLPASTFGCSGNDLDVSFSATATLTADDFEDACGNSPAISGEYQSIDPMSNFVGQGAMGTWTLTIDDIYLEEDGGALNSWYLEVCTAIPTDAAVLLSNNVLTVAQGMSGDVSQFYLEAMGTPGEIVYTLLSVPENGTLNLSGAALELGETFSQTDINGGLLVYTHDGSSTTSDGFLFDIVEGGNHWLHEQFFQIEILENTITASSALTTGLDCHDENTAVITVTASGGNAPLEYSLNGGAYQMSNVFGSLSAGTYTVTVRDADGLTLMTNEIEVDNPPAIIASADVVDDDVTVNASGGTGSLEYSIDGVDYQASNQFPDLPNGAYTVYVRDENGCIETTTAVVAVNTIIITISYINDVSCAGANDGAIEVNVAGGMAPFEYSLNGGPVQMSNVFENVPAGMNEVSVMDAVGFMTSANFTVDEPLAISGGASATGYTVNVSASGGTGTLMYNLDGGPFQMGNEFFPVGNGAHTVTVLDENECEFTIDVTVDVPAIDGSLDFVAMLDCHDSDDGSIMVNANGGVGPYEYSLNGGSFQMGNTFDGLSAGTYEVTIMDSGGFETTLSSATISAPPAITAGTTVNGNDVTVNASGGTGALLYSLDGGAFQSSNIFINVMNGIHQVTIQDMNGCEETITVSVNSTPLQVTAEVEQGISCPGESDAVIVINAAGGVDPLEFSLNGIDFQMSNEFTGLSAGSYQPTVRDATGAIIIAPTITIVDPFPMVIDASAFGPVITADVTGGTGDYQYSFDGGAFQMENFYEVVSNGTYTVVVMDENGCTVEEEVEVNKPEGLFLTLTDASCANSEDGIIVIDGVEGGFAPYEYSLNGGAFSSQITWDNLVAGEYTITVRDATGYEWTADPIVIDAPPAIDLELTVDENTLTVDASGGAGDFQYSIDGGATFQDENVFENVSNGSYDVVVMDGDGCTVEMTVTINYNSTFEVDGGLMFEVLPNPSAGMFVLRMETPNLNELTMTVHDVSGRIVYENEFASIGSIEQTLDLQFLSNGTYQLRVSDGELWGVKRLVIIK